jgi:hypothetical protein
MSDQILDELYWTIFGLYFKLSCSFLPYYYYYLKVYMYNLNRTKLDKNDTPEYRERERYATQKAEEIFKVNVNHIFPLSLRYATSNMLRFS